jgi:hypothetical protein
MPGRSSIFSFETLAARPRLSASFAWFVALLVGSRLLLAWAAPDLTARDDLLGAAEYLRVQGGDLHVVFFGSSRLQTAIVPQEWAGRAGLRSDQVANLAVNDGRLADASYMVRHAGGLPASIQLVVIEISPWEFNRNGLHPGTGAPNSIPVRTRSLGTLSDRLAVDDITARLQLVADLIWPVYQRRPFLQWDYPDPLQAAIPPPPRIHYDLQSRMYLANLEGFRGDKIAAKHFYNAAMSTWAKRNLDVLLSQVRSPTRHVVLLQLPARSAYMGAVNADPQTRALLREVADFVRAHATADILPLTWELASDCGLEEDIFVDYGHFTLGGAVALTDRLYDELTDRGIGLTGGEAARAR